MGENLNLVSKATAAVDANDWDATLALLAPGFTFSSPMGEVDAAGFIDFCKGFYAGFPKLTHTVIESIESGDRVAARVRVAGSHTGPLPSPAGEIPATGRDMDLISHAMFAMSNGKITSWVVAFNQATMLVQLGLMPEPANA